MTYLRLPSLGSPAPSTCWPIMQKVHCGPCASCSHRSRVSHAPAWSNFPRGTLRYRPQRS